MKSKKAGILLIVALTTGLVAQSKTPGISAVARSGSITGNRYTNSFFSLSAETPEATFTLNPTINAQADSARLVQVIGKPTDWDNTFTFAILADSLARYPQLQSSTQYVRSVRHILEKQGLPTVKEEFPIMIGGLPFTGTILEEHVDNGKKYYRGLYATFLRGYILSFDAEASSQDKVNGLVQRIVKFTN
jgi:hypothetical protein